MLLLAGGRDPPGLRGGVGEEGLVWRSVSAL